MLFFETHWTIINACRLWNEGVSVILLARSIKNSHLYKFQWNFVININNLPGITLQGKKESFLHSTEYKGSNHIILEMENI